MEVVHCEVNYSDHRPETKGLSICCDEWDQISSPAVNFSTAIAQKAAPTSLSNACSGTLTRQSNTNSAPARWTVATLDEHC